MKKLAVIFIALFILNIMPSLAYATNSVLIKSIQISLKNENPSRLEVSFDLNEPIHLSQGSSNVIYEYFTRDNDGDLSVKYDKNKNWSGYLNSYDNYPSGEHKYSSGYNNEAYSNLVPATRIYTSVKTSASIDVTTIAAVRVTVIRANGSGEKVTILSNGTISAVEKIEIPIVDKDTSTGIILESTTAEIPANTVLIANQLTNGPIFELVSAVLDDVKDFLVFEINLELNGEKIRINDKVNISIPIPENFDNTNLAVYRINNDGIIIQYYISSVTAIQGVHYATFETDHFSTYVLAEGAAEKDITPKTGIPSVMNEIIAITIISAIGIIIFHKKDEIINMN